MRAATEPEAPNAEVAVDLDETPTCATLLFARAGTWKHTLAMFLEAHSMPMLLLSRNVANVRRARRFRIKLDTTGTAGGLSSSIPGDARSEGDITTRCAVAGYPDVALGEQTFPKCNL